MTSFCIASLEVRYWIAIRHFSKLESRRITRTSL
ncbi:hypothetical protein OESDEN_16814 [Oesophagostomum dentatum]|uniref:Uncharacterized protein n=1 Tax=Oesophagostomum dentatum TaxID=61180 RepID=A0A0B1SDU4_OESDE|nr:hypothetical protein OESDEN_16814 [Oesophagostomum dentatum]